MLVSLAATPQAFAGTTCTLFPAQGSLNIPPGAPQEKSWALAVGAPGTVMDLDVVSLWGSHGRLSDLSFRLESPLGTVVSLLPQQGSCNVNNAFDISFDDEGLAGPPPCPYDDALAYVPLEPLSTFDGEELAGTWTLLVNDAVHGTGGTVSGWGIEACYEASEVDLTVTKDDGVTEAEGGGTVVYTIVVTNAGPAAATDANVVDTLPAALTNASWTCIGSSGGACTNASGNGDIDELVDLPVGGSVTFTLTATVDPATTADVTNTVTVQPQLGVVELNASDNSASDTDSVVGFPTATGFGTAARLKQGLGAVTQVWLAYDEAMGASAAQTTSFLLAAGGTDGVVDTLACGPLAGDDVAVAIDAASYDAASDRSQLEVNGGVPLPVGNYALLACGGSLADAAGQAFDGDGDGTPGDDHRRAFLVKVDHLLETNVNFDADVAGWTLSTPTVGSLAWDAGDSSGVASSGSLRIDGSASPGDGPWTASQCVDASANPDEVSFRVLGSVMVAGAADALVTAELFDAAACGGALVHTLATPVVSGTTAGWVDLASPWHRLPVAGVVSARITLQGAPAAPLAQGTWTVAFDETAFWGASIFHGDLETGDTSQWSTTVP